ncbi:MAG: Cardiolipin synthetase [uncultured Thermomicrobiales bacterium]|uniref:phospholipase D n=1 Tax=uncultured Thermomicrobiales bacterium TaxID=1645740 RepID=A0A6J4UPW5_9BACT|nr:MAG: Cardiolipin synthetase [uncultured Thermomicrobiales bacterium]
MTGSQRAFLAALLIIAVGFVVWLLGGTAPRPDIAGDGIPTATARPTGTALATEGVTGVVVLPDDGREPILAEIAAAERSIDLVVYLLSDEEVISALVGAVERGVEVRVMLEEHPFGGNGSNPDTFDRLDAAGASVKWSNPAFRFSHVKMFVIDDAVAIIMNLNLSRSAFDDNREFAAVTTRGDAVAEAAAIFAADWTRAAEPSPGPLIVSPVDSRSTLIGLIDAAAVSLDIYAEVMRDEAVLVAIERAEDRGVAVRLLMSPEYGDDDRGSAERERLATSGVEIRYARGVYVHAKAIVADGTVAWIGSQNFTSTSLDDNREVGIVLDDPANVSRVSGVFDLDFARGRDIEVAT